MTERQGRPAEIARRGILALALALAFAALALRDSAGAGTSSNLLPEGLWAPAASAIQPLDGAIRTDGVAMESIVFTTSVSPEEVVRHFRYQWEGREVELVEGELPEGRSLVVLDLHEGLRWTVVARRRSGTTEVVRSLGRESLNGAPPAPPLELPEWLAVISQARDEVAGRAVETWVATELRPGATLRALCEGARARGWAGDCGAGDRAGLEVVDLSRGEESLTIALGHGPLGRRWATIRREGP